MAFKVALKGFPAFEAKMKLLGKSNITPVMRTRVLQPGGQVLADATKTVIPVLSGESKNALTVRLSRDENKAVAWMMFDFDKMTKKDKKTGKKIRYIYMVNRGTKPHKILAGPGGRLHFRGQFRVWADHPGSTKGKQFFQRGLARGRERSKRTMEAAMKAIVDERLASGPVS